MTRKVNKNPLNIMKTQDNNPATQDMVLPAPTPLKIPQHLICKELAEKGYRAKQVSEITGIKYNNVAWYFSKYKLTEVALAVLTGVQPVVVEEPTVVVEEPKLKPKSKK